MANTISTSHFQPYFPYIPAYSTWEEYNGNLILYHSGQPIPFSTEDEWQHTARNVAQLPVFSAYPIPDPSLFTTWQDWAHEFGLILNGKPR